jgi:uncharacterized membrane protein YbhN (UPF0104 family)
MASHDETFGADPRPPGVEPRAPRRDRSAEDEDVLHELVDYAELEVRELTALAEAGEAPPAKPKRWWVMPLRLVISAAMLLVLYFRIPSFDWSALVPEWQASTLAWLGLALALTLGSVVLSAVRWQQVLHALDLRAPLRRLTSLYFAGQFVSNVLPTTIGGDVLRISRLSKDTGDSADVFASVALERLTGWLVLPLLTLTGLAIDPELRDLGQATHLAVLAALVTLGGLVLILVLAGNSRLGGRFRANHAEAGSGWRRFIGAVHFGVGRLRRRPGAPAATIGAGIAFQLVLVLAAAAAARAMGISIGFAPLLAFYPVVLMTQVLPIGIAGLGLRESAIVVLLSPLGVPAEQALGLGLMLYLLNVAAGLFGGPSFAIGGRAGRPAPDGSGA